MCDRRKGSFMTVASREFKPLHTAGLIIGLNFDPIAVRS